MKHANLLFVFFVFFVFFVPFVVQAVSFCYVF